MLCLHAFLCLLVVLQTARAQSGASGDAAIKPYTAKDIIRAIEREVEEEHLGSAGAGSAHDELQDSLDSSAELSPDTKITSTSRTSTSPTKSIDKQVESGRLNSKVDNQSETNNYGDEDDDGDEDFQETSDNRSNEHSSSSMEFPHLEKVADMMKKLKKSKTDEEMAAKLKTGTESLGVSFKTFEQLSDLWISILRRIWRVWKAKGAKQVMHSIVTDMVTKTEQTIKPHIDSIVDRGLKSVTKNKSIQDNNLQKSGKFKVDIIPANKTRKANSTHDVSKRKNKSRAQIKKMEKSTIGKVKVTVNPVNSKNNQPSHLKTGSKRTISHVNRTNLIKKNRNTKASKNHITTVVSFVSDKTTNNTNNTHDKPAKIHSSKRTKQLADQNNKRQLNLEQNSTKIQSDQRRNAKSKMQIKKYLNDNATKKDLPTVQDRHQKERSKINKTLEIRGHLENNINNKIIVQFTNENGNNRLKKDEIDKLLNGTKYKNDLDHLKQEKASNQRKGIDSLKRVNNTNKQIHNLSSKEDEFLKPVDNEMPTKQQPNSRKQNNTKLTIKFSTKQSEQSKKNNISQSSKLNNDTGKTLKTKNILYKNTTKEATNLKNNESSLDKKNIREKLDSNVRENATKVKINFENKPDARRSEKTSNETQNYRKRVTKPSSQGLSVKKGLVEGDSPMNLMVPQMVPKIQVPVIAFKDEQRLDEIQGEVGRLENEMTILQTAVAGVIKKLRNIEQVTVELENASHTIQHESQQQHPLLETSKEPLSQSQSSEPSENTSTIIKVVIGPEINSEQSHKFENESPLNTPSQSIIETLPVHSGQLPNTTGIVHMNNQGTPVINVPFPNTGETTASQQPYPDQHRTASAIINNVGHSPNNLSTGALFPYQSRSSDAELVNRTSQSDASNIHLSEGNSQSSKTFTERSDAKNQSVNNVNSGNLPPNTTWKESMKLSNEKSLAVNDKNGLSKESNKLQTNDFTLKLTAKQSEDADAVPSKEKYHLRFSSKGKSKQADQSHVNMNAKSTAKVKQTVKGHQTFKHNSSGKSEKTSRNDKTKATGKINQGKSKAVEPLPLNETIPTENPGQLDSGISDGLSTDETETSNQEIMNEPEESPFDAMTTLSPTEQSEGTNPTITTSAQTESSTNAIPYQYDQLSTMTSPRTSPVTSPIIWGFGGDSRLKPTPPSSPPHQIYIPLGAINNLQPDLNSFPELFERNRVHSAAEHSDRDQRGRSQNVYNVDLLKEQQMLKNGTFEGPHESDDQQKTSVDAPQEYHHQRDSRPIINIIVPNQETASYLQKELCVPTCKNGGKCVGFNTCKCPAIFSGDQCERFSLIELLKKNANQQKSKNIYDHPPNSVRAAQRRRLTIEDLLRSLARNYRPQKIRTRPESQLNLPLQSVRDAIAYRMQNLRNRLKDPLQKGRQPRGFRLQRMRQPFGYRLPLAQGPRGFPLQRFRAPSDFRFENSDDYHEREYNDSKAKSIIPRRIISRIDPVTKRKQFLLEI